LKSLDARDGRFRLCREGAALIQPIEAAIDELRNPNEVVFVARAIYVSLFPVFARNPQ
jgi:hypothetical protein